MATPAYRMRLYGGWGDLQHMPRQLFYYVAALKNVTGEEWVAAGAKLIEEIQWSRWFSDPGSNTVQAVNGVAYHVPGFGSDIAKARARNRHAHASARPRHAHRTSEKSKKIMVSAARSRTSIAS